MLEGKEIQGNIGDIGGYFVDASSNGIVEIGVSVKVDLLAEIKKLAAKTATPIDDQAVAWIEALVKKA